MDVDRLTRRRVRGITAIEMLLTLAVAAVALAIVVPSWSAVVSRSQVTTAANGMLTHLRYARSEAIHRQRMVSLCPSVDGQRCSGDPRGWHKGYLVFDDIDGNRSRSANEPLLRTADAQRPGLTLHSTAGRPAIRFRPDGAAWSTNTTFSVCRGEDPAGNRAVILYGSGRARVNDRGPGNRPIRCS